MSGCGGLKMSVIEGFYLNRKTDSNKSECKNRKTMGLVRHDSEGQ